MPTRKTDTPAQWRYAQHYLLSTALTGFMLCGMTLYFGTADLRGSALDVAQAVLASAETQGAPDAPGAPFTQHALSGFRDAERLQVCLRGQCTTSSILEPSGREAAVHDLTGLTCATAANPATGNRATACMSVAGLWADIWRDALVLLLAQAIGYGIWLGASRRFAAHHRHWNALVQRTATTDAATGLLNRASFRAALDRAKAQGAEAWLVTTGIDELKSINQLYGSPVGDKVIRAVAERLSRVEGAHTLGRLGGDEFSFLIDGSGPAALERALYQLRRQMTTPISIDGLVLHVTVCVGAVPLEQCLEASELKRRANVALRTAKKVGAGSQSIFNEAFDAELCRAHQLRLDFMSAVDKDQIELVYQPIVNSRGQILMAEALARWNHPSHGPVSPEVFIAAAESCGLIHVLGIALLKKACRDLVLARKRGVPLKRIAVNISPAQLNNPDLAQLVIAVVEASGLVPADIELELTESAVMASGQGATAQLHHLAEAGFSISIDDFGTGYSSLSRLQTLPISKLKIDRSFVQAHEQASGAVLLEVMLDLSRRLGLACVAEGIETEDQMIWLQQRGCELFQGYLIGKPMPLHQLTAMGFRAPLSTSILNAGSQALAPNRIHSRNS